ncbi:MAG: hypothetical protein CMH16_00820 [Methylobacterium sp.]|nr:hypothetical protein [Methylobacterium sp.]
MTDHREQLIDLPRIASDATHDGMEMLNHRFGAALYARPLILLIASGVAGQRIKDAARLLPQATHEIGDFVQSIDC